MTETLLENVNELKFKYDTTLSIASGSGDRAQYCVDKAHKKWKKAWNKLSIEEKNGNKYCEPPRKPQKVYNDGTDGFRTAAFR